MQGSGVQEQCEVYTLELLSPGSGFFCACTPLLLTAAQRTGTEEAQGSLISMAPQLPGQRLNRKM